MSATLSVTLPGKEGYDRLINLWGPGPDHSYEDVPALEQHAECFADLKEVLKLYQLEERFEGYLLHRHYEINSGEMLVDERGPGEGEWTIHPAPASMAAEQGMVPVVYHFHSPSEASAVMFSGPEELEPLTQTEKECLQELGRVLCSHGINDWVGISVVHRDRHSDEPVIYLETKSQKVSRHQVSEPSTTERASPGAVATHFRLRDGDWLATAWCHQGYH